MTGLLCPDFLIGDGKMDISKIKKGAIFKNYKDMCQIINESIKTGEAKQNQLEDWQRYFEYEKNGRKFKINKVYTKPKLKLSSIKYREIIKALVLDLLIHNKDRNNIQISNKKLLKQLEIVNNNYFYAQNKQSKLAAYTQIPIADIKDFYNSSGSLLKNNIDRALVELQKEAIIICDKITYICKLHPIIDKADNGEEMVREKIEKDQFGDNKKVKIIDGNFVEEYRPATEKEKDYILQVTNEKMIEYVDIIRHTKDMRCDNSVSEIIKYGYWEQYISDVKKLLKQRYNISFYYQAYDISFNYDNVVKRWKAECKALGTQSKKKYLSQANKGVCENINHNAELRQEKAYTLPIDCEDKPLKLDTRIRRSKDEYLQNEFFLTNLLIDHDTKIFTKELDNMYR